MRERAILLAAALAAFGASLAGPFQLDDYAILSDPVLTAPSGWWEVWRPLQTRPLTYFTFWLNYQLGGAAPAGDHAVNLALHLGVVWLAFGVLSRLASRRTAFIGAAVLAIHPLAAEPVNYIFARGTLLAALLCLAALDAWLRGRSWMAVFWFAAALAAKEECAAFPLALVLLGLAAGRVAPLAAMCSLSLAAGLRVVWATSVIAGAGAGAGAGVSPASYLAAQGPVILRYLRLIVLPYGFTADPDIPVPAVWWSAPAWAAMLAAALFLLWRRAPADRWLLAGLVLLLPSSSLFPASDLAADRRMYLPLFAFGAAAGLLLERGRTAWLAAAAVLLVTLSAHRTWIWNSPDRLWTEAVEHAPAKVRPRIQLARAVDGARAVRLLMQAKAIAPDDPEVPAELGRLHLQAGHPELALAEFGRALALDPCLFDARLNLRRAGSSPEIPGHCRFTPEQARALR